MGLALVPAQGKTLSSRSQIYPSFQRHLFLSHLLQSLSPQLQNQSTALSTDMAMNVNSTTKTRVCAQTIALVTHRGQLMTHKSGAHLKTLADA